MNLTQNHLIELDFKKDATAPTGVNRYEKSDGETHFNSSYWASFTFSSDGEKTLYGIINFHSSDGNGYIIKSRKFEGAISVDTFDAMMDKNRNDLPSIIREYPTYFNKL